jgi:hypothetical protein
MITGTSCPHPLYRITGVSPHQHAATDDFAEALPLRYSAVRGNGRVPAMVMFLLSGYGTGPPSR